MNRENIDRLGKQDVVMAGYPGSGAAWLGCVMVNLGIFYLDGYHEILDPAELHKTRILDIDRRDRLPDYRDRDKFNSSFSRGLRVVKTHLPTAAFGDNPQFRALVLVRDGRDSLISYYHWLCNFAGMDLKLDEFLRDGQNQESLAPAQEWAEFYSEWLRYLDERSTCLVRFEDMRENPVEEIRRFCSFLGVSRSDDLILDAVNECSYSSMRAKESEAVGGSSTENRMIMRRGEVGEWRSVLRSDSLDLVQKQAGEVLKELGYSSSASH